MRICPNKTYLEKTLSSRLSFLTTVEILTSYGKLFLVVYLKSITTIGPQRVSYNRRVDPEACIDCVVD